MKRILRLKLSFLNPCIHIIIHSNDSLSIGFNPMHSQVQLPDTDQFQGPIQSYLEELLESYRSYTGGALADYIPELAKADGNWFGIAVATVDGSIYQVGDCRVPFTIQSISKPFTYALSLDTHGIGEVLKKVGVEPSGEAFNEISLELGSGRPFNPMINAGAIATTGLIQGDTSEGRFNKILKCFEKFAAHKLAVDEAVYLSESDTGNRNRAIAYMLRNSNILEDKTEETLDVYFRQCSILVNCRDLAVMGATLANNGINPVTGVIALKPEHVEKVLSIMSTCGMYDYAGGWIYGVGMPAKSGVSGGIMAVLPGQFGIGVFSPLLDEHGNSEKGIKVCQQISADFGLHMFDTSKSSNSVIRAKYDATTIVSKRMRSVEEYEIIRQQGDQIKIYELSGDLIFSATDFVLKTILDEINRTKFIIFDCKRVSSAKKSACRLLGNFTLYLLKKDVRLFFTNTDYQFDKYLKSFLDRNTFKETHRFPDIDLALEWCEMMLLQTQITTSVNQKILLVKQLLLRDFTQQELALLKASMKKRIFSQGDTIIQQGAESNALYFLTVGEVSIMVKSSKNNRYERIATLSAGMSFGEMSLIDRQERSASVVAESYVECYELSFDVYDDIKSKHPAIKDKLLTNLAMDLANKLRKANQEIRAYQ